MNEQNKYESKPLVSVVTPVYNGEKFMIECIESVIAQTYTNWEYIIIDNCSTDGTPDIIRQYAEKDDRIVIYRNDEIVDVITNHNIAYQKISSESTYCKLLQADDWLFSDCLEKMVAAAESRPDAGIIGAYSLAGKKVRNDGLSYSDTCLSGREVAKQTLIGTYYLFWSPSSLMIRSALIRARNPFYDPSMLHADVDTLYLLLRQTDFCFVHQVLTFIRVHDDSLTSVITKPMNRMILSNLHLYLLHGPTFLTKSEYDKHLKVKLHIYYRFLARNALELRQGDFWKYHEESLKKIGLKFDRAKLVKAVLSLLVNDPRKSIQSFFTASMQRLKR